MEAKCERCGQTRYPLYFISTVASRHIKELKNARRVCEECLSPQEHFLIVELPKINQRFKNEEPQKITCFEYEKALYTVTQFKCPFNIPSPEDCKGHCYIDDFDRCIEYLRGKATLKKVWSGKLNVKPA